MSIIASGPWGDPGYQGTVHTGLPELRRGWIEGRADVQAYDGRPVKPQDNGYLSDVHASHAAGRNGDALSVLEAPLSAAGRRPLRASGVIR